MLAKMEGDGHGFHGEASRYRLILQELEEVAALLWVGQSCLVGNSHGGRCGSVNLEWPASGSAFHLMRIAP